MRADLHSFDNIIWKIINIDCGSVFDSREVDHKIDCLIFVAEFSPFSLRLEPFAKSLHGSVLLYINKKPERW